MKTIYKYLVDAPLPSDIEILHIAEQNGKYYLWGLTDPRMQHPTFRLTVLGTGHPVDDNLVYVGTFHEGSYVWHLFK